MTPPRPRVVIVVELEGSSALVGDPVGDGLLDWLAEEARALGLALREAGLPVRRAWLAGPEARP